MKEVAMENDTAKSDVDVVDSSLQMVADASAYIGVISRKYGQTPLCPDRNPKGVSITELEYDEAQELHRPILLFIMGDKHPITEAEQSRARWSHPSGTYQRAPWAGWILDSDQF